MGVQPGSSEKVIMAIQKEDQYQSVTLQLPASDVQKLDEIAARLTVSRAALIRLSVKRYLSESEQRINVA
jgi:metal-responsive CopG/Arc/MetJ family transcriptional regulator